MKHAPAGFEQALELPSLVRLPKEYGPLVQMSIAHDFRTWNGPTPAPYVQLISLLHHVCSEEEHPMRTQR